MKLAPYFGTGQRHFILNIKLIIICLKQV